MKQKVKNPNIAVKGVEENLGTITKKFICIHAKIAVKSFQITDWMLNFVRRVALQNIKGITGLQSIK